MTITSLTTDLYVVLQIELIFVRISDDDLYTQMQFYFGYRNVKLLFNGWEINSIGGVYAFDHLQLNMYYIILLQYC